MTMIKALKKNKLAVGVFLTYIFLFIAMPDKGTQSVKNSMYYVREMLEIIPVVFLLTSLIEAWVPKEVIINSFGEKSGVRGSILSLALGSLSAGPIYAAFPVCKMLLKKGASIWNIVIILSAWAVVKVPMLVNEAKFLGVKFMIVRWILTIISILVMAYIVSLIVRRENIPFEPEAEKRDMNSINIKEQYCIGCGLCTKLYPDLFVMNDGKANLIQGKIAENSDLDILEIVEKCPVKAIQLS
ncbi:permease [Wukongibacter baidiensis]|uniref:permease n=1 Tax=Wukongibacter baidiensis TaxID=1723361 RepID=UPI003D7FF49C